MSRLNATVLRVQWQLLVGLRRLLTDQRGQSMVEYSTITFFILGAALATGMAVPVNGENLITRLYSAFQVYVDSLMFSLSLAVT